MTAQVKFQAPLALRMTRHAVGMMIVALAHPLIYNDGQPVLAWISAWAMPLAVSLAIYGLYALFFTNRAKAAWPNSFIVLAWVMLALVVFGPWLERLNNQRQQKLPEVSHQTAPAKTDKQIDWEKGVMTPPSISPANHFSDPNYGKELLPKKLNGEPVILRPFNGTLDAETSRTNSTIATYTWEQAEQWSGNHFDKYDEIDVQANKAITVAPEVFTGSKERTDHLNRALQSWRSYAEGLGSSPTEAFHYSIAQILYGVRNGWGSCLYAGNNAEGMPTSSCSPLPP